MKQFTQEIRGHIATVTHVATHEDGTPTWEVAIVGRAHRFTLEEWKGFGAAFCMWALNQWAEKQHKTRHDIDIEGVAV